eukprot:TRINITY_DN109808_c0_g1_i1.p1 TRINITY_DN109808_c0_g1~~TRINITY_DN109808_c0_g1_i1.p1  ORF type:complete len:379 (-),score=55.42 TRINITY_DN109808_c0_g1_i1:22-1071(-)
MTTKAVGDMAMDGDVVWAYMLVFSVQLVFTGYQLLTKVALGGHGVDPIVFALVRSVGTSGLLLVLAILHVPRQQLVLKYVHLNRFALLGCCMAGNVLGLIAALEVSSSGVVAILQVMRPIFAGLISRGMGMEKFSTQKIFGMAVCLSGALTVAHTGADASDKVDGAHYGAFIYVCIHSIGLGAYVSLQPALLDVGYSPLVINAYSFLVAAVICAVLLPMRSLHRGDWWQPTWLFFATVVWSICLVGAYSYVAMGWAAKRVGSTTVMLFMLLQAILTVAAGRVFLGEEMHAAQLVGGMLIIIGILIFTCAPTLAGLVESRSQTDFLTPRPRKKNNEEGSDEEDCLVTCTK